MSDIVLPGFSVRFPFHAKNIRKNSTTAKPNKTKNSIDRFDGG